MYCKNCGKELKNDENFCSKCGCQVERQNPEPSVVEQYPTFSQYPQYTQYPSFEQFNINIVPEQPKKANPAIAIVAFALGISSFFLYYMQTPFDELFSELVIFILMVALGLGAIVLGIIGLIKGIKTKTRIMIVFSAIAIGVAVSSLYIPLYNLLVNSPLFNGGFDSEIL